MSIPATWDLEAEIVGFVTLVHLDTTQGPLRFMLGEDGWFEDADGTRWLGSKLLSTGRLELSIGDRVPASELSFTYTIDPGQEDLVSVVRAFGVSAVRGRVATYYIQPLVIYDELFRPTLGLITMAQREMTQLSYSIVGPQERRVSVIMDGPMNLASAPPNGRYNTADATRRNGGVYDPSFEFMPASAFDEQSLFGL